MLKRMKDPGSKMRTIRSNILLDKMPVTFAKPNKNDKIEKENFHRKQTTSKQPRAL